MADSPNSSPPSPSSSGSSGNSPPPPPPSSSSSDSPSPPSGNDDNNNNNNNNNNGGGGNTSPPPPPPDSSSSSSSQPPPSSGDGGRNSQTPPGTGGSRDVPVPVAPGSGANSGNVPRGSSPSLTGNKNADSGGGGGSRSSSSSSSSSSSLSSSARVTVIVGLVGFCVALILMVIICIICSRRKKKRAPPMPPYAWQNSPKPPRQGNQHWQPSPYDHAVKISPSPMSGGGWGGQGKGESGPHSCTPMESSLEPSPSFQLGFNKSTFTYEELAAATKGFDQSNMLGQGGFGYVHKGVLPNGKQIAVKSLKSGSGQGDREFHAEVEIISRVHHRHLVSLVGYCIAAGQRMLVYEFVPNNTLEHHLHKKGNTPLDFSIRLRIALGSAKGLAYLHEDCHPRIIHRDIKASNILLDDNFEAMVADFGLAKLTTDTNTHVSTRVMGTFGYLAPEYASSGKLTEKSDVFSFGVMLLELITGRRPVDPDMKYMEDSLVDWSRPLLAKALETGNYDELADPRLERNYTPNEMQRMVACAAASIRHSSKKRPKMSQIVRALEGDVSLEDLNDGTKAGQSSMYGSPDTDYDSRQYSADLKKFRQMAFATQDFASSEYGGTTSEYGLNPSMSSSDSSREATSRQIR